MRDKNQLIGWLLIGLVFVGFMIYSNYEGQKQLEARKLQQSEDSLLKVKTDSLNAIQTSKAEAKLSSEISDSSNVFFQARQGVKGETIIENELLKLTVSNTGGQLIRAELKDSLYKSQDGSPVILFNDSDNKFELLLDGKNDNIRTSDYNFTPEKESESIVVMHLPVGSGSLNIRYSLIPKSYLVNIDVQAIGMDGFFSSDTKTFKIDWSQHVVQQEKGFTFENRYSTITYRTTDDDTDELSSGGSDKVKEGDDIEDRMYWVSFKTQFFSQILISDGSFKCDMLGSKMDKEGSGYLKELATSLTSDFDPTGQKPTKMCMYLGPNKFSTLKENEALLKSQTELDLQSIVYLGWPIINIINRFVFLPIFDFMTHWGLNMGLVLILITIIVKICVYPLMKKSYKSSANMRVLKPKVDELNSKYPNKEDAMAKNQAMMQLYSEYGVSPMGGCLPMLIQMPIWIALFNFIPNAIELRGQSFLWANDLSSYDDVIRFGSSIWGIGDHLSLFCILWCISTWVNTWISMRQQSFNAAMSPEQQQSMGCMKWMSYLMPLIFFFSFNSYSSGLNLYYFVSGLITILMMWYMRASTDDDKLLAQLEARRKARKSNPKKTMSMMERFQAMAEQQRSLQEKNGRRN